MRNPKSNIKRNMEIWALKMTVSFAEVPAPGSVSFTWDGQDYQLVGSEPHTRQDGSETTLLLWSTNCQACGVEMTTMTPMTMTNSPRRKCDDHKRRIAR